jgi:hypothetical protein
MSNNKKETPKRLSQCKTIAELKAFLEASEKPTSAMDAMLVRGGKLGDLVSQFKKQFPESKTFPNVSRLKAHCKFRQEKQGWQFETKDDDYFKLKKIT